ncbi:MAG TPA: hypothetical protein VF192_01500 [Longimicrobiales bacterium]
MTPTALLYRAEHGTVPPAGDAICWLCGVGCPADGPRADDVIRSTFNDHARARRGGDSDVICAACAWYFDYRIGQGHGATGKLFTYSLRVLESGWRPWQRSEIAGDLLLWIRDGLPEPAVLVVNYSRKKHVLPWARVNAAGTRVLRVATDEGEATIGETFTELLGAVVRLRDRGHRSADLVQARPTAAVLARSPAPRLDIDLLRVLERHRGPALQLAIHLTTEEARERLAGSLA